MKWQLSNQVLSRLYIFLRRQFRARSKVNTRLNKIKIGFFFLLRVSEKVFCTVYIEAAKYAL